MTVSRNDVVGWKRFEFQAEKSEAVGADFRIRDAAYLMGFVLVVEEDVTLLNGEGVVADGIGAKAPVNQQKLAKGVVAVHGAVVLFAAELLLCDVEKRWRFLMFKGAGKRVRLKKTVHIRFTPSLDSHFYYATYFPERFSYPA